VIGLWAGDALPWWNSAPRDAQNLMPYPFFRSQRAGRNPAASNLASVYICLSEVRVEAGGRSHGNGHDLDASYPDSILGCKPDPIEAPAMPVSGTSTPDGSDAFIKSSLSSVAGTSVA